MARIVSLTADVATGNYQAIQPGAGVEWVVHNVFAPNGVQFELYWYNGTDSVLIGVYSSSLLGYPLSVTNDVYLRIKNTSGATAKFGWSGAIV